jgi:hypothetical protein
MPLVRFFWALAWVRKALWAHLCVSVSCSFPVGVGLLLFNSGNLLLLLIQLLLCTCCCYCPLPGWTPLCLHCVLTSSRPQDWDCPKALQPMGLGHFRGHLQVMSPTRGHKWNFLFNARGFTTQALPQDGFFLLGHNCCAFCSWIWGLYPVPNPSGLLY